MEGVTHGHELWPAPPRGTRREGERDSPHRRRREIAVWRQIMADVFGVPVVGMVEDEGAALGGALQAAWCVARREGRRNAKISEFTEGVVALDEATRCVPNKANVAVYRDLQAAQDQLSSSLRTNGIFARHRALSDRR